MKLRFNKGDIDNYWSKFPEISELLTEMSKIEDWTEGVRADISIEERLENAIQQVFSSKESLNTINDFPGPFIVLMFFLDSPSAIYVYRELTKIAPSFEKTLQLQATTMLSQQNLRTPALVFWDRIRTLATVQSVSELFSPARLKEVNGTIEFVVKTLGAPK